MKIQIENLDGQNATVDLSECGPVYDDDDVIYFGGTPYRLSTAHAPDCAALVEALENIAAIHDGQIERNPKRVADVCRKCAREALASHREKESAK